MKIVQRLYLRDFLILLCLLSIGLSAIFALLDVAGKMEGLTAGKPSASLLLYAFYNVPRFLLYLLPLSVLVCSLFTFTYASHRKEITAIKSAGGRLRAIFYPFVATGAALSIFAFITGEIVVPDFSQRAADLKSSLEGKAKGLNFQDGVLWLKSRSGFPVKIGLYIPENRIAKDVTVFITRESSLEAKITAGRAIWDGHTWVLEEVTKYDMDRGTVENIPRMNFGDLESPDVFTGGVRSTDEMGLFELYSYMQRLRNAGFRNTKMAVDINSKISFPLINIFMMLLGIALALEVGVGSSLFSAGLGLLISLVYWFSYTFTLSMGYAGIWSPFFAAWSVPLAFCSLAVYLYVKMPE